MVTDTPGIGIPRAGGHLRQTTVMIFYYAGVRVVVTESFLHTL